MKRLRDVLLIVIFAILLIVLIVVFTISRFGPGNWGQGSEKLTAFGLIVKEQKTISELNILKSHYAQSIIDYQSKLRAINSASELTVIEKAERKNILNRFFSKTFFNQQILEIDQKQSMINQLEERKCQFTYSNSIN